MSGRQYVKRPKYPRGNFAGVANGIVCRVRTWQVLVFLHSACRYLCTLNVTKNVTNTHSGMGRVTFEIFLTA